MELLFSNFLMRPFRLAAHLAAIILAAGLTLGWLAFLSGTGLGMGLLVAAVFAEMNGAKLGTGFFLLPWMIIVRPWHDG